MTSCRSPFVWLFVLLLMLPGLGQAAAGAVRTVAIWDFDNNTVADLNTIASQDYLSRALPEMLIAQLAGVSGLKLVERVNLRQALEELKLGSSKLTDDDSKLKLGKLVGARQMAFGSFMALGDIMRIDVRVVETETSVTLLAETEQGSVKEIPTLAAKLAKKVAKKLAGGSPLAVGGSQKSLKVWQEYDKGVQLMDDKKFEESIKIFEKLLKAHPDFKPAEKQIELAVEKLSRM